MFVLILVLAGWAAASAVYRLYQVGEGEHEHKQDPLENAISATICVGLAMFLLWVALNWC